MIYEKLCLLRRLYDVLHSHLLDAVRILESKYHGMPFQFRFQSILLYDCAESFAFCEPCLSRHYDSFWHNNDDISFND